jgi:hypothetical protein
MEGIVTKIYKKPISSLKEIPTLECGRFKKLARGMECSQKHSALGRENVINGGRG